MTLRMNPNSLIGIETDALVLCTTFLRYSEVINLGCCCKSLISTVSNDSIWREQLRQELDIESIIEPPGELSHCSKFPKPVLHSVDDQGPHYRLFKRWRLAFHEYRLNEVKLARVWWLRMETWLSRHSPIILSTLNPPAELSDFETTEADLGHRLPRLLKLLYRFHNGQSLLFDNTQFNSRSDSSSISDMDRLQVMQSIFSGLFGGYTFYDQTVNIRFIPLQFMKAISSPLLQERGKIRLRSRPRPRQPMSDSRSNFGPLDFNEPNPKLFVFACNVILNGIDRVIAATETSPSMSDGVFTTFGDFFQLLPACPTPVVPNRGPNHHPSSCPDIAVGGALFCWLDEYLCRLEEGSYSVERTSCDDPASPTHISLFPFPPPSSSPQGAKIGRSAVHQPRAATAAAAASAMILETPACAARRVPPTNSALSQTITSGIEVTAASIFVPQRCSPRGGLFWTYTIRLRLLGNHPSRPHSLNACQLTDRHWLCTQPNLKTAEGELLERVDGAGVIGLHPILAVDKMQEGHGQNEWPFFYQSCSTASSFPAGLSGSLDFVPLSAAERQIADVFRAPTSSASDVLSARVDTLTMTIPDFIY